MQQFDIAMVGHVSQDLIVVGGVEEHLLGGAVVHSSAAASRSGAKVLVVTKAAPEVDLGVFAANNVDLRVLPSRTTTSIRNVYESSDRERRTVTLLSQAEAFCLEEISDLRATIVQLAGLFAGEIPDAVIRTLAGHCRLALDAQGVLRRNEHGRLVFRDWEEKATLLPYITYLKTDAAEAEILTGTSDRGEAARVLVGLGAREVMVTHNAEVLVFDGRRAGRAPFTSRNLSGRTGRGDTCFASYLAWRLGHDIEESVHYAAALTSMKMERPGPFSGTVAQVLKRVEQDRGR